ncbi:hypothetical protein [Tomitella fengzijianii]|uniref:Uncharacterized protein n=1 Tax=Tomitella fengzijianii TaxID=2597660 RepID=A0A516X5W3_9ACTN|nr:hypothetical protein [Tomitella fengzijianii]QDQ98457.1 hypothetical protein FO059_15430 [Tomitella fengzijianii]
MSIRTGIPARITLVTAAAATLVGTAAGAAVLGTGAAQAMPTEHDATNTVVVQNDTDSTMFLDASDNYYGSWVQAPAAQVAPHSSATISATGNGADRLSTRLDYHLSGISMAPRGDATLFVSNSDAGVTTDGTVSGGDFAVLPTVQAGGPHATVVFDIR